MAAVADVDPFVRVVLILSWRRRRTSLGDFNQLLGLDGVLPLASGDIPEGSEAVLYLRVSTARQMNTAIDISEGGNSSATQREVATLRLPAGEVAALRQRVADSLEHQQAAEQETRRRLKKELGRLDVKEERLLDLAADGGLVGKKLRKRLRDLQMRRAVLRRQLECTDEQLRREADTVLAYLDLLADPGRFYELASPVVKRKLLTAFYAQIWLDDDQHTLQPVTEPREIVTRLHQAARCAVGGSLRSRSDAGSAEEGENMADGVAADGRTSWCRSDD